MEGEARWRATKTRRPSLLLERFRTLVLGGPTAGHVLASLAWSGGLLAGFALLAIGQYQRISR